MISNTLKSSKSIFDPMKKLIFYYINSILASNVMFKVFSVFYL